MLMLSVILALLLGWCTGGRLSRFEEADLRLLPLPVLAFACQQAMNALAGRISLPFGPGCRCCSPMGSSSSFCGKTGI